MPPKHKLIILLAAAVLIMVTLIITNLQNVRTPAINAAPSSRASAIPGSHGGGQPQGAAWQVAS